MNNSTASLSKTPSYSQLHQRKSLQQSASQTSTSYFVRGKHDFSSKNELVPPNTYSSAHKRPQSSIFQNNDLLKESLSSIAHLRANSPTFKTNNPITAEGHQDYIFRSSIKKTALSDIDNIKSPSPGKPQRTTTNAVYGHLRNTSESKLWKPSVKQASQKETDHYELFEKRGLRQTTWNAGTTSSVNPLLGEDCKAQRIRLTGNGDQQISDSYKRIADRREMQSAQSATRAEWMKYKQSNIFGIAANPQIQPSQGGDNQSVASQGAINGVGNESTTSKAFNKFRGEDAKFLLAYRYALPYTKVKELTEKIGHDQQSKFLSFNQVNDIDFRKKSNQLGKEEAFALTSQKQNDLLVSQDLRSSQLQQGV